MHFDDDNEPIPELPQWRSHWVAVRNAAPPQSPPHRLNGHRRRHTRLNDAELGGVSDYNLKLLC